MGLDMHDRQKITEEIHKRYQRSGKKGKAKILDEFTATTGYNRDYAAHLLSNWGKARLVRVDGKLVKLVAKGGGKSRKRKRTGKAGGRPRKYHEAFAAVLKAVWEKFDYQCGKLLAPMIRLMIDFLVAAGGKELPVISEEIRRLLIAASPATIDRLLKKSRDKLRVKGKSLTKRGPLLKNLIPIRTYYSWDEMKPGFFELDTVSHCGIRTSGNFCSTLTLTDVYSGWTEERSLRNRAHRWVKEQTAAARNDLPFPMLGIDFDNGGEFINYQLIDWCNENHIQYTRGRPYRKNDNCFVEQKNFDVVRKTVGYFRFDTDEEQSALAEVYRYLCPLVNYWYPTIKVSGKTKLENGRYKKQYAKALTPCQRLLESLDVSPSCKRELKKRMEALNPVTLKTKMDEARERLLQINRQKVYTKTSAPVGVFG